MRNKEGEGDSAAKGRVLLQLRSHICICICIICTYRMCTYRMHLTYSFLILGRMQ